MEGVVGDAQVVKEPKTSRTKQTKTAEPGPANAVKEENSGSKEATFTKKQQRALDELAAILETHGNVPDERKEKLLKACVKKMKRGVTRPETEKKVRSAKQIAATERMLAARREKLKK